MIRSAYFGADPHIVITIATPDREWKLFGNADECIGAQISYALDLLRNLGFRQGSYTHTDGTPAGPWEELPMADCD